MMAEHEDGDGAPPQLHAADRGQRAQISDYTLLEFLGEGATAQVYLAEHVDSGDRVAIKVIDKLLVQHAQLEGKVRQEMVLHTELHHPFVLQVQDVFEDARNFYMVLEYCARRSLATTVKTLPGRRMDESMAKKVFRQVRRLLSKTSRSVFDREKRRHSRDVLLRLGVGCVSDAGSDEHATMCGTPNFIAPEVLASNGAPYDEAVDVWSLGCILYSSTRAQQSTAPRQREPLRSPPNRKSRRAAALSSTDDEPLRTSRVAMALKAPPKKRNALVNSRLGSERRRSREGGGADGMDCAWGQALPLAGVDNSSSSSDDSSVDLVNEEFSDLSELSTPAAFKFQHDEETKDQAEEPLLHESGSTDVRPVKSVVVHLELQNLPFLGLSGGDEGLKAAVEWTCEEPLEVGRPPLFKLKVSNGWEAQYDPGTGVLTATSPDGNVLIYEIPALVRFCQCLALRTVQLRRIALRGEVCKLPFVHYDTFPESLLASFRYRATLAPHSLGQLDAGSSASSTENSTGTRGSTEIPGIGCGYISTTGDLRVVYLDGAQLTLAASGLQLRFRPSWANNQGGDDNDDVFDLLTGSNMSAFLPSAVKQKLESIPEFIRRLKAGS
ncbi:hypothetical protein BBJ28_00012917 [Nothophytophthora sp. Chile5]|nr:hypothetical protein BBJ28_00012917 [Nothophytophthora sp. Chile5]